MRPLTIGGGDWERSKGGPIVLVYPLLCDSLDNLTGAAKKGIRGAHIALCASRHP